MPDITLEKLAEYIQGSNQNKEGFLRVIRRILRWETEERPTVKDLIFDPWLIEGFGFTDEQIRHYREHWLEKEGEGEWEESRSAS